MGLSCGNPTAFASLRPGEVVVDLGCGGGMDIFLAAGKVGPTGKAIGIDMTPEMIERAQAGAAKLGATNTEFHLAQIDALPLADNSVDCVISNCVINLAPDKRKVFREIFRVLKPGGRVAISDLALRRELPPQIAASLEAYVGCIAGALHLAEFSHLLEEAGFTSVVISETGSDLNAYMHIGSASCCGSGACCEPSETAANAGLPVLQNFDANHYAASVRVHGLKQNH
jgi:SAM-dependent methyltransferase